MILCMGSLADQTFCHTIKALMHHNVPCDVVDIGQLYLSGDIDLSSAEDYNSFCSSQSRHHFADYKSVYTRLIDISDKAPSIELQKRSSGFYQSLRKFLSEMPVPVLNPPTGDQSNFTKLYHSTSIASENNWLMPCSCLTNNPATALQFVEQHKQVIYKGCSSTKTWARKFTPADIKRLKDLKDSPVLFQQLIEGPDVRIHIVGDELFAEKITSSSIDYRTIRGNNYQKTEVPPVIHEGCINLVKQTGTPLLGVDFKIDHNTGDWYFLEANNMPCYQGYDKRTGHRISGAIVNWLTKN